MRLIEQAHDILNKWEFFQGQRSGRELWSHKPKEVQDQDIADFNRDIQIVRSALEAEPVRHGRWETFLDEDWGGNTTYLHGHKKCGYVVRSCLEKGTPYCPNCGAKMDGDERGNL